ncbi:uncharacterized protein F5147DRAFT_747888 [Suillus discolor]|uniref:Transposase n=1 Tax=Suillus discolor TaxID=1912936 RepID=A0A9P7EVY6_9AGAM|nr:uncharacterized protein F5147DRAFT_747888 [Suillus discolor]KAG2093479.1 hypothetical protein F5147DRAFT_747888 [Suillus discolor]
MTTHFHHNQDKNEMAMLMVSHSSSLNTSTSFLTASSEDVLHHLSPAPALEVDSEFYGTGKSLYRNYHTGLNARPCDASGNFLPPGTPPIPLAEQSPDDWSPFRNQIEFETAEFLYSHVQMSTPNINTLLDLWAASLLKHGDQPPFADCKDLYNTIDNIPIGGISWQSFKIQYSGEKPVGPDVPPWMNQQFEVWYCDPHEVARNILTNPDYVNEFDYHPFHEYSVDKDEHCYQDFMLGNWAWQQADIIAADPDNLRATFVPIILRSDKTTVSISTGNNKYYPLYLSIGNVHNNVRRAHRNTLCLIGFLAIPKKFQNFQCQIFHSSLTKILETLKDVMSKPEVIRFRPYIADYEEQVLLTSIVRNWCPRCLAPRGQLDDDALCRCEAHREALVEEDTFDVDMLQREFGIVGDVMPFTNDFPHANIHQLIAPDILHQIIKGCFKDHLVTWVEKYLHQDALCWFHHYHPIFLKLGIIPTFSLPRQHAMKHYPKLIRLFGAPNGLCSSMTENKHIKAVKQPWRRSNKYNALGQMLVTNQQLNKLAALHVDFTKCGMLNSTCLSDALNMKGNNEPMNDIPNTIQSNAADDNDNDGLDNGEIDDGPPEIEAHLIIILERNCAQTVAALAIELSVKHLQELIESFLFKQLHPHDTCDHATIPADSFPVYNGKVSVVNSASSRFYAPSDLSVVGGMNAHARYDCVFINSRPELDGMRGLEVARVLCFFSFRYKLVLYECAVVCWFSVISDAPDEDTGMWVVQPSFNDHSPDISVIHIDAIYRAAHLLPIYGTDPIPHHLKFYHSLDNFCAFYVNKFVDHHAFEIAF